MIEHEPWIGLHYKTKKGIEGQLIAVVGHSFWRGNGQNDSNSKTHDVLSSVVDGSRIRFYSQLRSYFGFHSDAEFLSRVLFINFLPECVGQDERFRKGSTKEIERARTRFMNILRKHKPHKVIVFSNSAGKGWRTLPDTDEERAGDRLFRLGPGVLNTFTWGTYRISGHTVVAFGLRHPQGANSRHMKKAVHHILAM